MDLMYIQFSDFTEKYETLTGICTQICLLMCIKFSGFIGSLAKIAKISALVMA